jgi:DNA polymerase V
VRLPVPLADLARRLAQRGIRAGDINQFLDVEPRLKQSVPLVGASASCGFSSPAYDYLDRPLDFNELIIESPAAAFAVRSSGDSMTGAGIFPGDIVVINRARNATSGCIVLALLDGKFTIKRYFVRNHTVTLHPENRAYQDIVVREGHEFEVWGVVTRSIRMF